MLKKIIFIVLLCFISISVFGANIEFQLTSNSFINVQPTSGKCKIYPSKTNMKDFYIVFCGYINQEDNKIYTSFPLLSSSFNYYGSEGFFLNIKGDGEELDTLGRSYEIEENNFYEIAILIYSNEYDKIIDLFTKYEKIEITISRLGGQGKFNAIFELTPSEKEEIKNFFKKFFY